MEQEPSKDFDGNAYKTVKIGNQVWIVKNLNASHYRNGEPIPQVQDPDEWGKLKTGAWCYYENDKENGKTYGKLYNWYAIHDPRGLAPIGWHVNSDAEWTILEDFLGGHDVARDKLKEAGTAHWQSQSNGNNISGFTALPGGYRRLYLGTFSNIGKIGYWWSATEDDATDAWGRNLIYNNSNFSRFTYTKESGFSVRCVRD